MVFVTFAAVILAVLAVLLVPEQGLLLPLEAAGLGLGQDHRVLPDHGLEVGQELCWPHLAQGPALKL